MTLVLPKLDGIELAKAAASGLSQDYVQTKKALRRMMSGTMKAQQNYDPKITTRINGSGWMTTGWDGLDLSSSLVLSCGEAKTKASASNVITIPAAACSKPTGNTGRIKFMPSNLGGMQLHYSRTGSAETFEYTVHAPKAGTYALTARVVTPSWKQHLQVAANGAKPVDIALPFTVGMWETTKPVKISLVAGENVLTFSREHEGLKGVTIRDFTLAPVT